MPKTKLGYICKTDEVWLAFHRETRERAGSIVYYRKSYHTPFASLEAGRPIFGFVTNPDVMLGMYGLLARHLTLTPLEAWTEFGTAVGAASLTDWKVQADRVLHGSSSGCLSFAEIDDVTYFDPPVDCSTLDPPVSAQTLQSGRSVYGNGELQALLSLADSRRVRG